MAGPRLLNTGNVVDPYAGLQDAVSQVGRIYQNYEENARRDAEFRAQQNERDRVKSMREFSANYDSRVGDDYRGINSSMRPLVEQSETQARQRWASMNPEATAEQRSAFDNELRNVRRSLASAEDVATAVASDYRRAGFSADEAEAFGRAEAAGYSSRGAALAQAQAEADARNKAADKMSDRLLDLYKARSASDNASIRALGSTSGSRGTTGGATGKSGSLVDPVKSAALHGFFEEAVGSSDARSAMSNFEQGMALYNENARRNGGTPVNFDQAQAVAISNLSRGGLATDNKALYRDPAEFAALLTEQFGPADATNTRTAGTGGDRQALIAGMRTGISNAERQAILNPSRTVVNPEQVARAQVASAYARLFPQAAQENAALVNRAVRSDAAPAGRSTAAASVVSGQRYRPSAPAPLEAGATRGTGFTDLARPTVSGSSQVAPAGVPSSPERQAVTPARALAEEIVAYQTSGTDGSIDLPRSLQTLQVNNPALYREVMREREALERPDPSAEQLSQLERSMAAIRGRIAADPSTLSTEVPTEQSLIDRINSRGNPRSPYQQDLLLRNTLAQWERQAETIRAQQAQNARPQVTDFTRLRSILSN